MLVSSASFLTALNVDKNPVRTVTTEEGTFTFDFSKLSLCMATTNQEKLCEPLRDRLRDISFEDYSGEELYKIFESNLEKKVQIDPATKQEIISVLRGNPRDAVVKAQDVQTYASATKTKVFTKTLWSEFWKNLMQIDVKRKLTGEGIAFSQTI